MANEVNNETEESKTGETSVEQTPKQDAPQASTTPAPEAPASNESQQAPQPPSAPAPAPTAPRTVAKPASMKAPEPAAEEPHASGDIDFGAILEQFEQEQTVYHAGELVEGKVVGVSDRGVLVDFGYKSRRRHSGRRNAASGADQPAVGDTVEVVIKSDLIPATHLRSPFPR